MLLRGKVAIVTGASRGIGKALALAVARAGAAVAVAARSETAGRLPGTIHETAAAIVEAGGRALAVRCDVTEEGDVAGLVERTLAAFGRIDLLVNNAGGSSRFLPIEEFSVGRLDRVIAANVRSVFLCSKAVLPAMKAQGGGVIVNISSDSAGQIVVPNDTVYGLVKAAVERFTVGLAAEVRGYGISVVALQPPAIRTEGAVAIHPPDFDWTGWQEPEEVAPALIWLAQQRPETFTGRVVRSDYFGKSWP
jgi:NAD(P)-dependent dehydrogenase (short-subunit alcohol dehydrogenase family)